ncbi:Chromatin-remodeling ATPase INO80 [Labeo rohita]|uniref:Chromatin-remodeling ATPase INO80 n=1 Tax=Labeo rohita TaxID=84645 RepID=A0ABQ8LZ95_LABRO|nr:Chromatin-remodeling ATPase INO80 [Labeo rohita]
MDLYADLPPLSPLSALVRPWRPYWNCLSALRARRLTNARPPSHFCLLHRCGLAAPLLTLSPPSVRWAYRGSASLHRHRGWRTPVSASSFRAQDCASARRPSGSTMAPSSSLPGKASGLPSSLVLPAPPWTVFDHPSPPASGCTSSLWLRQALHPFSSTCCSGFTVTFHLSPPDPPRHSGSSALRLCLGLLHRYQPVGPLELSTLPHPWHLPQSTPPLFAFLAVAWVPPGSFCSKFLLSLSGPPWTLLSSPWLVPMSGLPWLLLSLPWLLPPCVSSIIVSSPSRHPNRIPSSHPFLPQLFLQREDTPSRRGGVDFPGIWTCFVVCFPPHVLPVT